MPQAFTKGVDGFPTVNMTYFIKALSPEEKERAYSSARKGRKLTERFSQLNEEGIGGGGLFEESKENSFRAPRCLAPFASNHAWIVNAFGVC
ncbi:hypothetical protein SUGI_0762660 [Cryptomeria japonica]|nr:hypothetical protein SUGI_0762660 [Cryptomeria japonica]